MTFRKSKWALQLYHSATFKSSSTSQLSRLSKRPTKMSSKDGLAADISSNAAATQKRPWGKTAAQITPSPVQLTHIQDFPANSPYNFDTVRLRDLLGDPMIRECWQFNYMFDVDFLMRQFDPDVRDIVQVKIVHGSWQADSGNRMFIDVSACHYITPSLLLTHVPCLFLQEGCARYKNVEPVIAGMPYAFGTHHSKMMALLRHDDLAQ